MKKGKLLKTCSALAVFCSLMLVAPITAQATFSVIHTSSSWKYTGSGTVASWIPEGSNTQTSASYSIYLYYNVPENEIRPDDTCSHDQYEHTICGVITDEPSYDFAKEVPKSGDYLLDLCGLYIMHSFGEDYPMYGERDWHLPIRIDIGNTVKNNWGTWGYLSRTSDPVQAIIAPYQDGWRREESGKWYYVTDETEKARYCNCWLWIDGNHDGLAECYYFDTNGYLAVNVPAEWEQVTNVSYNHNQFFNATNENGAWYFDNADAVDTIFPDVAKARGIYYDVNDANAYKLRVN